MRPFDLLLLGSLLALPAAAQERARLTLEQTVGRGESARFSGSAPAWDWTEDGRLLERGRGDERRWVDPATWEETAPTDAADESADPAIERLRAIDGVDKERAEKIARREVGSARDGALRLFKQDDALWVDDGTSARQLTRSNQASELEELSPDGQYVGAVSGNDLVLISTADGGWRPVTSDGGPDSFNGKLDWVYQEEIYGRGNFKGFFWSPDSKYIAFLSLDEEPVHEFTVVDHIERGHFRVAPEITNYPKAGDPNPIVRVGIVEVNSGAIQWVDLERYRDSEPLVVRVGWSPDSTRAILQVQDRIQTWLELVAANPRTGEATTLLREESDSWVDVLGEPRWLADGSFLWQSHRTGYTHLYHYQADGTLIRPVTQGEWTLGRIVRTSEDEQTYWFTATIDGAVNVNVYRIGLDGQGLKRLTQGEGTHSVSFNHDASLFIDRWSSLGHLPSARLCNGEGEILRELGDAEIEAVTKYEHSHWELFELPLRDGYMMDAALLKPVNFDESKSYPVWISTYSGPNAPSVRNRWNGSTWFQFLAQNGVIVFQGNVRSASGKGHWSTAACYKQLGAQELADWSDAVDWLTGHSWADAERVGMTGYSYGGFMTAYALVGTDKFALGVAGGGVYDWAMYDTIYTERYMSTPQLNPEGYATTSVLNKAGDLSGHLFMHHGVMDDNVHVQNLMQFVYKLQKAGKDFEVMVYPQTRHGVRDADQRWDLRRREWRLIQEHLLGRAGS